MKPRGVVPTKEFSMALKLLKCFLKVADADGCFFLRVIMIRRCFTYYECDTKSKKQSTLQMRD